MKFILAIVRVDGDNTDGPHYVRAPFRKEPDGGAVSVNYAIEDLLASAKPPHPRLKDSGIRMTKTHAIVAPKKLIEVALPARRHQQGCGPEKSIRHGHPSEFAICGGRGRPLAAARAVFVRATR